MKYKILATISTTALLFILLVSYDSIPQQSPSQIVRQQRRTLRAEARQERYAQETRYIDSLIQSRNWQFTPTSISQFTGPTQSIFRNYYIDVWDNYIRVYLPYYKGYINQYLTILNFDILSPHDYTIEKIQDGWHITFSGTDFTGNTYTFVFDISTPSGYVNLEIRSAFYNSVSYSGSIN